MIRVFAAGGTIPPASAGLWTVLALSAAIAWGHPPEAQSYAQVRFTVPQGARNYFGLRRWKLMVEGDLPDGGHYYVQGIYKDHNRSGTDGQPYLQEAWVRWWLKQGSLTVGQFKPPFGLERFTADWDLDVIDRSVSTDSLIPNGKLDGGKGFARDRGVQWEARSADQRLWGALGLFEGHGANTNPRGIAPLVAARLVWTVPTEPALRLRVGGAFSYRDAEKLDFSQALPGTAPLGYNHFTGRDARWNLEAAWDGPAGRFRGEYFHARFRPDPATQPAVTADGFYLQASRPITPRLEAALKYEQFDPNRHVRDQHDLRQTTLGVTGLLRGRQDRVQVNYVWKRERVGEKDNDALVVQFQKFF